MKSKLSVFFIILLASLLLLNGCINSEQQQNNSNNLSPQRNISLENTATEDNTENLEINLDELQEKYNALNEKFSGCLEEKAGCESSLMATDFNCTEPNFDCPECPVSTDCASVASSLSSQINDCLKEKLTTQNSLDGCTTEKNACVQEKNNCISDLDAANIALAKPLNLSIHHYVKSNLFESEGYRYTQAFAGDNTKKVFVGLDYSGGNDDFFLPSVTITYGLNLVEWYAVTQPVTGTFETKILKGVYESDAGDTILIEEDASGILQLKINAAEFDSGTSKNGLALRRITVLYIK